MILSLDLAIKRINHLKIWLIRFIIYKEEIMMNIQRDIKGDQHENYRGYGFI